MEVTILPEIDPAHPGQFKWTSGLSPPHPVSTGTLVVVEATVETVRPLYYLLPLQVFKVQGNQD